MYKHTQCRNCLSSINTHNAGHDEPSFIYKHTVPGYNIGDLWVQGTVRSPINIRLDIRGKTNFFSRHLGCSLCLNEVFYTHCHVTSNKVKADINIYIYVMFNTVSSLHCTYTVRWQVTNRLRCTCFICGQLPLLKNRLKHQQLNLWLECLTIF